VHVHFVERVARLGAGGLGRDSPLRRPVPRTSPFGEEILERRRRVDAGRREVEDVVATAPAEPRDAIP
jgi:hypothetical protein